MYLQIVSNNYLYNECYLIKLIKSKLKFVFAKRI